MQLGVSGPRWHSQHGLLGGAFSGFDDTKADLVSHVDHVHFAPTCVPAKLKKR